MGDKGTTVACCFLQCLAHLTHESWSSSSCSNISPSYPRSHAGRSASFILEGTGGQRPALSEPAQGQKRRRISAHSENGGEIRLISCSFHLSLAFNSRSVLYALAPPFSSIKIFQSACFGFHPSSASLSPRVLSPHPHMIWPNGCICFASSTEMASTPPRPRRSLTASARSIMLKSPVCTK